jgi:hypothetical protein
MAETGQFAYCLEGVTGISGVRLAAVDLTAPAAPAELGSIVLPGGNGIRASGSLVYVAATTTGLEIVDVRNSSSLASIGTTKTPGSARDVAVANGLAYVADNTSVQIIDVHSPSAAMIVGALPTSATAVAVSGNRLYALDLTSFKVIDISAPTASVLLYSGTNYSAQGLDVTGALAFLAVPAVDNTGGILQLDLSPLNASPPGAPVLVQRIGVPGVTRVVTIANGIAYAGDSNSYVDEILLQ